MPRPRSRTVSGWPTDLATIAHDVGSLLTMEATLMTLSTVVAALFGEWYVALAFALAGGVTAVVGLGARRAFADAPDPRMKHGMIIAASGWLMTAAFGSLPFFLAAVFVPAEVAASYVPAGASYGQSSLAYFANPLHAFFESMSGWTGSGLTMAVHEPSLPRTIQWWRSLIQWVGGVGVIVLTVSILAPGAGGTPSTVRRRAKRRSTPASSRRSEPSGSSFSATLRSRFSCCSSRSDSPPSARNSRCGRPPGRHSITR